MMRRAKHLLISASLLASGLAGCNACRTLPPEAAPDAPVTTPQGPEIRAEAGKGLPFRAAARGAEGYEWRLTGRGHISATTGEAVIYTPPDDEGTAQLVVRAFNRHGASPETSLIISVLTKASVRLDTLAVPAGLMSGGGPPGRFISLDRTDACPEGRSCLQITYRPGGGWGGVCWWPPACGPSGTDEAWGRVRSGSCGIDLPRLGGLKAVSRLTFSARGEKGGEVVEFKVGASDMPPKPGKILGKVRLKPGWERYEIDLKGLDLSNAVGLFFWVATDQDNPDGAVFHLADITFEGER